MQGLNEDRKQNKRWSHSNGITYFSKKTERTIFFILTILMLLCGVLVRLGIL